MAIIKVTATINANGEVSAIAQSALVDAVANDAVAIYMGDTVGKYRALEIIAGVMWLYTGLRDRNLLATDKTNATTGNIYTASGIDFLNENERRTSWGVAGLALIGANDIGLAFGQTVVANHPQEVLNEIVVVKMSEWIMENIFKIS